MLFNSLHFLIFFTIVTAAFFLLPHRSRWFMLLVASCYFYAVFKPIYLLILGFTIGIDYAAGLLIEQAQGARKKQYLWLSIAANVGVLAVFKYYNFLNGNVSWVAESAGFTNPMPMLDILLPIGLSFHTFQSLSYTIEVYLGRQAAERNLGIFALYVMFYPQLVAGPIERPQNLLHQFRERFSFDYDRVTSGLRLMCWGLLKKVVIADRLAAFVDLVYNQPAGYPGITLMLATVFFAFQIYCDFSGYSDIAIGAARVMGFTLMGNFRQPYLSASVSEFWRRWHISLSTWFKDYVYIPLGGNRVSTARQYLNLMIVFLVSGLWHGANWTYVIWGGLNGVYLVLEQVVEKRTRITERVPVWFRTPYRVCRTLLTFTLICISWVFFRAKDLSTALYILTHMADGSISSIHLLRNMAYVRANILVGLDKEEFLLAAVAILLLILIEIAQQFRHVGDWIKAQPAFVRWTAYYAAGAAVVYLGAFNTSQVFIYFQF